MTCYGWSALFDAPPEIVFDAFVDPEGQRRLHGSSVEGCTLHRNRDRMSGSGGRPSYVMGLTGERPDTETLVFSVVDRPHRLVFRHTMDIAELGTAVETEIDDHVRGPGRQDAADVRADRVR